MSTHFRAVALIACVRKYFLLLPGLTPTYITEISPVALRGGIGVCNQLAVTSGIFLSQVLGLDVALGTESGWPWLLALGAVLPSALQVAMLPFMPESPSYLVVNKGDDEGGMAALCKLRKTREVRSVFTIWTLCWDRAKQHYVANLFLSFPDQEAESEFQDMKTTTEKDDSEAEEHVNVWQVLVSEGKPQL